MIGRSCRDNILNHIDKDGRPLCGEESCPLYRTMVTGVEASVPIIVFALPKDGQPQWLETPGTPLGIDTGSAYVELSTTLKPGDRVLVCSDGAFEVHNASREELGQEGFITIRNALDYPSAGCHMGQLEEALLKFSNAIRLQDDLTMIMLEYLG